MSSWPSNFVVRPKRQSVEPFTERAYWNTLGDEQLTVIEQQISDLPSEAEAFNEDEASNELANRFDNLCLNLQLQVLTQGVVSENERQRVMEIAQKLEEKTSIPAVAIQLPLIQDLQTIEFWQHVEVVSQIILCTSKTENHFSPYAARA